MDQEVFSKTNLLEVLTEVTGPIGTATHNRGNTLIDGIYVSQVLLPVITGGYLTFDAAIPSDHRALWIEIPGQVLGLGKSSTPTNLSAWQLQCKDPS